MIKFLKFIDGFISVLFCLLLLFIVVFLYSIFFIYLMEVFL